MQRIKFSRSQTSKRPGEAKQKNAANQQKMACSGTFGTPGWVRTSGLSLRRRPLYPTELRGLIQKIFNFRVQPDSNELPLRRRTLYPAELRAHTTPGISVNEYARCVGSVDKKDTLMFEKKNIFFQYATLLLKIFIISITQVYVICKKKSRYRETPTAI